MGFLTLPRRSVHSQPLPVPEPNRSGLVFETPDPDPEPGSDPRPTEFRSRRWRRSPKMCVVLVQTLRVQDHPLLGCPERPPGNDHSLVSYVRQPPATTIRSTELPGPELGKSLSSLTAGFQETGHSCNFSSWRTRGWCRLEPRRRSRRSRQTSPKRFVSKRRLLYSTSTGWFGHKQTCKRWVD